MLVNANIQPMKHFGDLLKELRLAFGYTQEELTDEIGFDRPNYVRVEGGYRTASDQLLLKLATLYRIPVEDFKTEREALTITQKYTERAIHRAYEYISQDGLEGGLEYFRFYYKEEADRRRALKTPKNKP